MAKKDEWKAARDKDKGRQELGRRAKETEACRPQMSELEKDRQLKSHQAGHLLGLLGRVEEDKFSIGNVEYLILQDEPGVGHMTQAREMGLKPKRLKDVKAAPGNVKQKYNDSDIVVEARPFLEKCHEASLLPFEPLAAALAQVTQALGIDISTLGQNRKL